MANTITYASGAISIVPDGTTDYDSTTVFDRGLIVHGINFYASAANDILVVKDGTISGTVIAKHKAAAAGNNVIPMYGKLFKPCIDASDCTFNTASSVLITMVVDKI